MKPILGALLASSLFACSLNPHPLAHDSISARRSLAQEQLDFYEHSRLSGMKPTKNWKDYKAQQGISVTARDSNGNATKGIIRVLSDNPGNKISLVAYGMGKGGADEITELAADPSEAHYFQAEISLKHKMEYRVRVNGQDLIDPAALLFSSVGYESKFNSKQGVNFLNSVFWDLDRTNQTDASKYDRQAATPDLIRKPVIIAESEVYELVRKWNGGPQYKQDTYKYIAESGVIDELKAAGYNAVEFVPFSQSVEGDEWKYRYQVFGPFAPDSRYGSPDEFARMCDEFNKRGMLVVMDAVIGHFPYKADNGGVRDLQNIGMHNWKKANGSSLYTSIDSEWGTKRYDFANPYVRKFLIDSILTMMRRYGIGGVRFDNFDGIRGMTGGWEMFQDLVTEIRAYQPQTLLIGEIFFGDAPNMKRHDQGGIGIDFRNDSTFFDFIKDNMLSLGGVNMDALRGALRDPWGWTGEVPRMKYITNHDEAANGRSGATGAYVATLIKGGDTSAATWDAVRRKTRAFATLAMVSGSLYMDMPQMRILQEGTFYSNPGVQWELRDPFHENENPSQRETWKYFTALSNYVQANEAFAFHNLRSDIEGGVDATNSVITIFRTDGFKKIYAVINLGGKGIVNYRTGVDASNHWDGFKVTIDSELGHSQASPDGFIHLDRGSGWNGKPDSVVIPYLAPYGAVVME